MTDGQSQTEEVVGDGRGSNAGEGPGGPGKKGPEGTDLGTPPGAAPARSGRGGAVAPAGRRGPGARVSSPVPRPLRPAKGGGSDGCARRGDPAPFEPRAGRAGG